MEWVHGQTGSTPLPRPRSKRLGTGGSGLEKGTLGVVLKNELAQLACFICRTQNPTLVECFVVTSVWGIFAYILFESLETVFCSSFF